VITLNFRDARPLHEQVRDGLRRLIEAGAIADGEKLPSVRQLAASLAVNPNTIQRAYNELEALGCIASVPGKGSFAKFADHRLDDKRAQFTALARELHVLGMTGEEIETLCKEAIDR